MQVTPNQDFLNRKQVSISSLSNIYFHCVRIVSVLIVEY